MKTRELTPILLDADSIAALPSRRLAGMESSPSKLLWRSGDSTAGVMEVEPGTRLAPHFHGHAHHHVWVLRGNCLVQGRVLGPGSYAHIPAGVDHEVTAADSAGATLFYLYVDESGHLPIGGPVSFPRDPGFALATSLRPTGFPVDCEAPE